MPSIFSSAPQIPAQAVAPGLYFSPRGEAKCVRGPSGRGARRAGRRKKARAGVLAQYVEHGKQAQRSHGGHAVCFGRWVVRNAGYIAGGLAASASSSE